MKPTLFTSPTVYRRAILRGLLPAFAFAAGTFAAYADAPHAFMNEDNQSVTATIPDVPAVPTVPGSLRAPDAPTAHERNLQAGPIHLKFADGELRYLHVGDKEIVRRIYFAVRDGDWDTAPPQFDHISIKTQKNGFTIDLSAHCVLPTADYEWTGKIVGTPDGKITFTASGEPGMDFKSNRIGLCILYGAPSLAGQAYETVDMDGVTVKPGTFPLLVSAALVTPNFQTLRYTTANGLSVSTHLTGQAHIDMEDQRTYSDSSYKAYAPLSYTYSAPVKQGDRKEETVTVSVSGVSEVASAVQNGPVVVRVGGVVEGAKVPQIGRATDDEKGGIFGAVNGKAAQFAGAKTLTWGYNPSLHLPDNDTYVENAITILDQVKSAHSYAPGAQIRISPLTFDNTHTRTNPRDKRNAEPFGALWSALMVKTMSLAGVSSAGFRVGEPGSPADKVQNEFAALGGKPVLDAVVEGGATYPAPVEAFAVGSTDNFILYLLNLTSSTQTVQLPPSVTGGKETIAHPVGGSAVGTKFDLVQGTKNITGNATIRMEPHAVVKVVISR